MSFDAILKKSTPFAVTSNWLQDFERAVTGGDVKAARDLFQQDSHWRDMLAFTWHLDTISGGDNIEQFLAQKLPEIRPRHFAIAEGRTPPAVVQRAGIETIEAIFNFETSVGPCSGVVRLRPDSDGKLRAWILLTAA